MGEGELTTTILQGGGIERAEPDGVNAQLLEVWHLLGDTLEISNTVPVGIGKGAGVDLVDACLSPPVWVD